MKKALSLILASLLLATAVSADIALEEGAVDFEIQKATATWTPDGVKSEGEYYDIELLPEWISTACSDASKDADVVALPVDYAMSWDDDYVYLWLSYEDATGHNFTAADHPSHWDGEIIQIGAAEVDVASEEAADRLEIGFGTHTDTKEKLSFCWAQSGYEPNPGNAITEGYGANNTAVDDYECFWDEDTITYEARVPFSIFTKKTVEEGLAFTWAVCMCIDGGAGAYTMWHLADGIAGGTKNPAAHATVTLAAAPVVETVAEVVEEAAAPQTFDAGVIAAVAAIVSAAGYAVSKKR